LSAIILVPVRAARTLKGRASPGWVTALGQPDSTGCWPTLPVPAGCPPKPASRRSHRWAGVNTSRN